MIKIDPMINSPNINGMKTNIVQMLCKSRDKSTFIKPVIKSEINMIPIKKNPNPDEN